MQKNRFVLCVDGVYIKNEKILLLKRATEPFKGHWHLIGGHVEENETLKQALKREFKEETALEIETGRIINGRIEKTSDRTKIIVALEVTYAQGEIKLNHENSEYNWFTKTPPNSVLNYDAYILSKHATGKNAQHVKTKGLAHYSS
jgi:ADP-ribose pyrophosphatase YjhB (NUDIX family)